MTARDIAGVLSRALPDAVVHGRDDPDLGFGPWRATPEEARIAARVECASDAHVATALRIAADAGAGVAVAGGRLGLWARNVRAGDIVLDLRRLTTVSYDPGAGVVQVGGGAASRSLHAALPENRVVPVSNTAGVGLAALATGGGYGRLNSGFGLTVDSLLGARVVLADGSQVDASPNGDADLYWALRGGGTGFGVITSLTLAVHELSFLLHCTFSVDIKHAGSALLRGQQLIDENPERLSMAAVFILGEDGAPTLLLLVDAIGDHDEADALADVFAQMPGAATVARAFMAFRSSLSPDTDLFPGGRSWATDHRLLPRFEESTAASLIEVAGSMPSRSSVIAIHDFHGKPTTIDPSATAFSLRRDHFLTHFDSSWDPGDDAAAEPARAWVRKGMALLHPEALPGGYINFLAPEETDRVRDFFGPAAARLTETRRRVDPRGVFTAATGIF